MNPKEFFHNTAYSVQLPYKPGLSLKKIQICFKFFMLDGMNIKRRLFYKLFCIQ